MRNSKLNLQSKQLSLKSLNLCMFLDIILRVNICIENSRNLTLINPGWN